MEAKYIDNIALRLSVSKWQVEHCIQLIEEGATIPFISRYRKERTGGLDEAQIAEIKLLYVKFEELAKRKIAVIESLTTQEKLTPELQTLIDTCLELQTLEDIYLPYRPKRRTRASIAKEKGLEPLANLLLEMKVAAPEKEAEKYLSDSVEDVSTALAGAKDIIAENVSERAVVRSYVRDNYLKYAKVTSKLAKGLDEDSEEVAKYKNYLNFSNRIDHIPSHRVLAILRASGESVLSVKVEGDVDRIKNDIYYSQFRRLRAPSSEAIQIIKDAIDDAFKRLIHPSIENDVLKTIKEKADLDSIKIFGENIRQLLMAPPLGQKRVLALDPGFRTGCKVVCLDAQGALLHNDTIYPHPPVNERIMAMKKISSMVESYKIEVIAIGNGTAGRETEAFIKRIALPEGVKVYSVSEDGASVYSASTVAREEFPDYDVTVRGAVSIGRRIMDPLAELVKIDPKSIGVGQYQHDIDQGLLKNSLDQVVESCVNLVGVNLNTASKHLLSYVSGIGPVLAANIVDYRDQNGPFDSRAQLLKVKRLGEKVYEQCAGFLRIPDASNPLDNSAVHPERYKLLEHIAKDNKVKVEDLIANDVVRNSVNLSKYVSESVGMPTLNDIFAELAKPGRDPRATVKVLEFSNDIHSIEDLYEGMVLPGIITNITNFGAFVDVGIKQNGLIHVSNMSKQFVSNPADVVKIHQHVEVKVIELDIKRNRIGLSLE